MSFECERAKLPVVLIHTDASTIVAVFQRRFIVLFSGGRRHQILSSCSIASALSSSSLMWGSPGAGGPGAGDHERALWFFDVTDGSPGYVPRLVVRCLCYGKSLSESDHTDVSPQTFKSSYMI
jgi:hypothetical protein